MDGEPRSAKRTRQACEPCRRKKTRCPGERPSCAYCTRLGQRCWYDEVADSGDTHSSKSRKVEDRMDVLEKKLDSLMEHLKPILQSSTTSQSPGQHPFSPPSTVSRLAGAGDSMDDRARISNYRETDPERDAGFKECLQRFMTYCHNQPVALFKTKSSMTTLDPALRLAIEALSIRFPPCKLDARRRELVRTKTKNCRAMIMESIDAEEVELSTLQTLCLLSMVAFSEGKAIQARLDLALASELAKSRQEAAAWQSVEGFDICLQSISMLQHLHGHPTSLSMPLIPGDVTSQEPNEMDIGTSTKLLADLWQQAQKYAACHVKQNAPPPWHAESDYIALSLQHMELDSRLPLRDRLLGSRLMDQTSEELHARREFFGPRIFLQFTYAGIACLLNHPFLLSLRLRECRHTVPRTFLRQSFEQLTRHAGWIIYFIDLLEEKDFKPSDQSLAHHVVVVATIHLQHSFVEDDFLREKARTGFEKCFRFLEQLGSLWPNIETMSKNLRRLQESIILTSSNNTNAESNETVSSSWSIDSHLLWNLLIHARAGQEDTVVDQSIFGPSLASTTASRQSTVAEFDLVGSVGITGHPAASSDPNPEYPPPSRSDHQTPRANSLHERLSGSLDQPDQSFNNISIEEQLWDGGASLEPDTDSLSWQVRDFGKAIDDWFTVGLPDRPL